MEKRKTGVVPPSNLPEDFLKMVTEIFSTNFDASLKQIKKLKGTAFHFEVNGSVYAEEIVLAVSLTNQQDLVATTVYASSDFDPKASSPTIQDLLNACVDAIGSVFGAITAPRQLENLLNQSLAALEGVPFDWTSLDVENRRIFVKIDKANPRLDKLADEWLRKNDPDLKRLEEENDAAMEDLFVTGPSKKSGRGSGGAGSLH